MNDSQTHYANSLWKSFLKGDDRAFAVLYQQYAQRLLSYGYRFNMEKEIVQDAMQEVFIDLYLKRANLSVGIANLKSYLFVSLKNNLLKKLNKKKRIELTNLNSADLYFNAEYSFQDQLIQLEISNETRQKLRNAVNSLSSKQKEIIFLKFEEELTYPDIARILNISVESARKQLYRALKTLRELIDPELFKILLFILSKKPSKNCPYFKEKETVI